jgi:hypothetical protein
LKILFLFDIVIQKKIEFYFFKTKIHNCSEAIVHL